jgi:hypothetical protein
MDIELFHKPDKENVVPNALNHKGIPRGNALGKYSNSSSHG